MQSAAPMEESSDFIDEASDSTPAWSTAPGWAVVRFTVADTDVSQRGEAEDIQRPDSKD